VGEDGGLSDAEKKRRKKLKQQEERVKQIRSS
jgi:hypothetical protein